MRENNGFEFCSEGGEGRERKRRENKEKEHRILDHLGP